MKQPERNRQIVAAYREGATMRALADKHGLSLSRISYIIRDAGGRLTREEWVKRHSALCREISNRPEVRAKISATIAKRWAAGHWAGRRKLFADDPAKREDYLALRDAYGAAYAREAMGLAA